MKDIIDQVWERIKNPYFGYFSISFIVVNWDSLFFLFFSATTASYRINYFSGNTNIYYLLVYPAFYALLLSFIAPIINFISVLIAKNPNEWINSLQVKSEHKVLIEKAELEQERARKFSEISDDILDQAKKLDKLDEIKDVKAREEARNEILEMQEELRKQRIDFLNTLNEKHVNPINDDETGTWNPEIILRDKNKKEKLPLNTFPYKAFYEFISRKSAFHLEFDINIEVDESFVGNSIIIKGIPFALTMTSKPLSSISFEVNSVHKIAYVTVNDPFSLVIMEESNGFLKPLEIGESWSNIKISGNFGGETQ